MPIIIIIIIIIAYKEAFLQSGSSRAGIQLISASDKTFIRPFNENVGVEKLRC